MIRTKIRSSSDPADSFPWADVDFDPITLSLNVRTINGLKSAKKHAAIQGEWDLSLEVGKLTEPHALIVTVDGELQFLPMSELPRICYAHLAFYDPATKTAEVLEFVDEPRLRDGTL